jgi:hypothetical protein
MKSVIGTMPDDEKSMQHRAQEEAAAEFHEALLDTRDEMARLLARAWRSTPLRSVTFAVAVTHLLAADAELAGSAPGPRAALIRELFEARGIATPS